MTFIRVYRPVLVKYSGRNEYLFIYLRNDHARSEEPMAGNPPLLILLQKGFGMKFMSALFSLSKIQAVFEGWVSYIGIRNQYSWCPNKSGSHRAGRASVNVNKIKIPLKLLTASSGALDNMQTRFFFVCVRIKNVSYC